MKFLRRDAGLALRMTWRDWRAGELTWLLCALLLGVAALTSVHFLSDRLAQALTRDATQLLAADLRIASDAPLPAAFIEQARQQGLRTAAIATFPSMVRRVDGAVTASVVPAVAQPLATQLAAIKAVSVEYPLRGQLKISRTEQGDGQSVAGGPALGEVWVDGALLAALQLRIGDMLAVGERQLKISAVLTQEMDRGAAFLNFAPRAMMRMEDLASTQLVTVGSRVTYRYLLADGAPNSTQATGKIPAYQAAAKAIIAKQALRGIEIETLDSGPPQIKSTLERAERFLSLVALLTVVLAAVAMALAGRHFMGRHLDACALYKCLGLSGSALQRVFLLEFVLLGAAAGVLGTLLGYAFHWALLAMVGDLIATGLPAASAKPWAIGLVASFVLLLGFAAPPLWQLAQVSPMQVLRRDWLRARGAAWLPWLLGLSALLGLIVWSAQSLKLGLLTALGFAGAGAVFAALGFLSLGVVQWVLKRYGAQLSSLQRLALAALVQRRGLTVLQMVSLAIGLMALLLLGITRQDLLQGWRAATPVDAPNRFVLNILPEQKDILQAELRRAASAPPQLYPMVRGRLTHINGTAIKLDAYPDERAKRLIDREFNLSYNDQLPPQNRVVAGRWFAPQSASGAARAPEISVEEGIAKTLSLKLGDVLRYEVAGQTIDAPITSLRKLDWSSMQVNFFVIFPQGALDGFPETWITALHLPSQTTAAQHSSAQFENNLIARYPNLTVMNTESILKQVQGILDKVIAAVELLFMFTLAAGILVWVTGLMSSAEGRARDAAILRTLGASSAQLKSVQRLEQAVMGGLAGLLAALGATALGWGLARFIFEFSYPINFWVFPLGIGLGIFGAWLASLIGLRGILSRPALTALRSHL